MADLDLKVGETRNMRGLTIPADAEFPAGEAWSVSDPSLATLTPDDAANSSGITGAAVGEGTVTLSGAGLTVTKTFAVTAAVIQPTALDIAFDPATPVEPVV